MRNILIATALLAGAATPALAQEGPFSGPRVEAVAGYDAMKAGDADDAPPVLLGADDESVEGVTYGVRAGYDFDLGSLVAGVEAEATESSGDARDEALGTDLTIGRDLYVGGRLGFKASPATLVYAGVGYTNMAVDGVISTAGTPLEFDGEADGYRLSGGLEQLFGEKLFSRLEYRYSNYGNFEIDGAEDGTDIDVDRHQVVASVGIRF